MGAVEIARMLGVSRQRVNQHFHEDPTFPGPWRVLATGRFWDREAVLIWARSNGREVTLPG